MDFRGFRIKFLEKQEKTRWVAIAPTSRSQWPATPTTQGFQGFGAALFQGGLQVEIQKPQVGCGAKKRRGSGVIGAAAPENRKKK